MPGVLRGCNCKSCRYKRRKANRLFAKLIKKRNRRVAKEVLKTYQDDESVIGKEKGIYYA